MSSTPEPAAGVEVRRNWGLIGGIALIAAVVIALDQATKYWAAESLAGREPVPVIGELIQLRLIHNPGAAFSIASGLTWLLTLTVVVVIAIAIRISAKVGSRLWTVGLGLLLGGAVGNLIDRFVRPPGFPEGHVVDFIDYAGLFVGNVADIAIVVAVALIALLMVRGIRVDGSPAPPAS